MLGLDISNRVSLRMTDLLNDCDNCGVDVNGVPVALDETAREVSRGRDAPGACARDPSSSSRIPASRDYTPFSGTPESGPRVQRAAMLGPGRP